MKRTKFSIVIPALHESDRINSLIENIEGLTGDGGHEVIVVDGSPAKDTIRAIVNENIINLVSPKGRARQMNAGASIAKGEILIFLHADTELPCNALKSINSAMAQGRYVGGAFELGIDSRKIEFKILARWASLRCRLTRIPYGDQAIFIERDYFNALGGYRDVPLMEDIELMRRIKRRGEKICIVAEQVKTSPRRWEDEGFIYVNVRNAILFFSYMLGVSPEKLVSFYKDTYKKNIE
jgi:rSAM/selenodomain-associated transferase 2